MPIKKIKEKLTKKRKITYKELEWDYLPLIVLFAIVSGILTLLLILLILNEGLQVQERNNRIDTIIENRNIRKYLENSDVTPTPIEEVYEEIEL